MAVDEVVANHLVCHDVVKGDMVILDEGQKEFHTAFYLFRGKRDLGRVALELHADAEGVAALTAVEDGLAGMKGYGGGGSKDVACAVGVDDNM